LLLAEIAFCKSNIIDERMKPSDKKQLRIALSQIESALDILEEVKEQEQEYLDNAESVDNPNEERVDRLTESVDTLETNIDAIREAVDELRNLV
jgi:GTP1/Obg family GTP-binding protein